MNQSQAISLGMILIFIGILVIITSSFFGTKQKTTDIKSAGIIFIGPFPVGGWGSSKTMYYTLMMLGFVLFFFFMFFYGRFK